MGVFRELRGVVLKFMGVRSPVRKDRASVRSGALSREVEGRGYRERAGRGKSFVSGLYGGKSRGGNGIEWGICLSEAGELGIIGTGRE